MRGNKRDIQWIGAIAASFAIGLAASWDRWGNPLVDCGREMNQPLRLYGGQMLYSDVRHIYGPLSPYLNALLYRIFTPSLSVLYFDGIVCAALIIGMVYWLARQLMTPLAAAASALSVMWLCAFKQAGNYLLPYSFSALHGCALGLICLILIVRFIKGGKPWMLAVAGLVAGITILAKTEMGGAAIIAGCAAALLITSQGLPGHIRQLLVFGLPALLVAGASYGLIAMRTGLSTLTNDSFLFFTHLPPELIYFNKRMSGFDNPLQSLVQIAEAGLRYSAIAVLIAAISMLFTRRTRPSVAEPLAVPSAGNARIVSLIAVMVACVFGLAVITVVSRNNWDQGPYLVMPFLLAGMLAAGLTRHWGNHVLNRDRIVKLVLIVYALASLARVLLRVRSGGAYSSYLLPVSVILFTYFWVQYFPRVFNGPRARSLAAAIAVWAILVDSVLTGALLCRKYRATNTYPVTTARGTMIAVPDLGKAFGEAIDFINHETLPGDSVAVFPEGTSLDFLTGRTNPLREEITTPGFLDKSGQARAIDQIKTAGTGIIFVVNRATPEFGASIFGQDYCQDLMNWIDHNYQLAEVFGPDHDPNLQIGDRTFFIKAYKRVQNP